MVVLPAPQTTAPGGILEVELHNFAADERRRITVHLCPFDPVSFDYTGSGLKVPTIETNVHDTFNNFAAVIAPYYTPDWLIEAEGLYYNAGGGQYVLIASGLPYGAVPGTNFTAPSTGPTVRRIMDIPGIVGRGRRFWFSQIAGDSFDGTIQVSTSGGGIDTRDVSFITYVSGAGSGTCAPNGYNFEIEGSVRQRIHRPIEEQATETYVVRFNAVDCNLEQSVDNGATWTTVEGWDIEELADCLELDLLPRPIVRWDTSSCSLQVSLDNGATYSTLPGWDLAAVQACVMASLQIRFDGGQVQWSTDGGSTWTSGGSAPPPNPQGVSTDQQACNIATWLAINILSDSLGSMASSISSAMTLIDSFSALLVAIPVLGEIDFVAVAAAKLLFDGVTSVGHAAVASAATDPVLQEELQCAIYNAIKADGYVTNSNYAAVSSAINAISYGTPGIIGIINDYLNGVGPVAGIGAAGLEAIQARGTLYVGDCSACTPAGPFCASTAMWDILFQTPGSSVSAFSYCTAVNVPSGHALWIMADISPCAAWGVQNHTGGDIFYWYDPGADHSFGWVQDADNGLRTFKNNSWPVGVGFFGTTQRVQLRVRPGIDVTYYYPAGATTTTPGTVFHTEVEHSGLTNWYPAYAVVSGGSPPSPGSVVNMHVAVV